MTRIIKVSRKKVWKRRKEISSELRDNRIKEPKVSQNTIELRNLLAKELEEKINLLTKESHKWTKEKQKKNCTIERTFLEKIY